MNSTEIRKIFFDYFEKNSHTKVPSSSLIPAQDPTLLFTNAGMNQFKDVFLGKETRSYTRAVSIQKCIRAGGKHNDLENVGFTKRHLTFFEMMGNFSFGDYFKKDAISFAWEFLTKELKLDANKLYASVYKLDDEAYDIWHKHIGLPESRIVRLGEADNFWQMGDTGPCGPCSEIYIDRGAQFGCSALTSSDRSATTINQQSHSSRQLSSHEQTATNSKQTNMTHTETALDTQQTTYIPRQITDDSKSAECSDHTGSCNQEKSTTNQASCAPGCHCDRFLEIWNLVFMQYDRQQDGTDKPLKQTGVDTGMGLERLCTVMQHTDSVFEIDIFAPIIERIEQLTSILYKTGSPEIQAAFRVLCDHIRSSCFAIADGATPSNEGRGYVLRKIIRRAALFAQKLHQKNIFPQLAQTLIQTMSAIYPELKTQEKHIVALLTSEVEKFSQNLIHGQQILAKYIAEYKPGASNTISGEQAFKLYDTYGFPLELTKVIAQERGFTVDSEGFEQHMEQQRIQSGKKQQTQEIVLEEALETTFTGYDEHVTNTKIVGIIVNNQQVSRVTLSVHAIATSSTESDIAQKNDSISASTKEELPVAPVLKNTSNFQNQEGKSLPDINIDERNVSTALSAAIVEPGTPVYVITKESPFFVECGGQVSDQGYIQIHNVTMALRGLKKIDTATAAVVELTHPLTIGDSVTLVVDTPSRLNTMKNHTATHLLQAALIEVLGKQVRQSGSVVEPDYLRFDFTYHENLTQEQVTLVEDIVNKKIQENIPVTVTHTTLAEASKRGVMAIFGEKYNPEHVRVVEVPGFSAELCGGTHVHATGDIGCFKITDVSALSAGNRRITALTGLAAIALFQQSYTTLKNLGQEFKVPIEQVAEAIKKQKEQLKQTVLATKELKKNMYHHLMPAWIKKSEQYNHVPFLYLVIKDATMDDLREIAAQFLNAQAGLYFLVGQGPERAAYFVTLSAKYAPQVNLKQFGSWLKEQGLQGGGSGTTLQGGATAFDLDLEYRIKRWLQEHIQKPV